jgi:acyl-CoA thioesterase
LPDVLRAAVRPGGRYALAVVPALCAGDGVLFGGSLNAVLAACAESTGDSQTLLSLAVQFVASIRTGDRLDIAVRAERTGRRVSQMSLTGSVQGRTAFAAVAAVGQLDPWTYAGLAAPRGLPSPDACEPRSYSLGGADSVAGLLDVRLVPAVSPQGPRQQPGRRLLWARVLGCTAQTSASLGMLSDHIPLVATQVLAPLTRATTIAGSLQVLGRSDSKWVLVDALVEASNRTIAVGRARLWSADGTFLGKAEQTLLVAD